MELSNDESLTVVVSVQNLLIHAVVTVRAVAVRHFFSSKFLNRNATIPKTKLKQQPYVRSAGSTVHIHVQARAQSRRADYRVRTVTSCFCDALCIVMQI